MVGWLVGYFIGWLVVGWLVMVAGLTKCVALYLDMFWASGLMPHQVSPDETT